VRAGFVCTCMHIWRKCMLMLTRIQDGPPEVGPTRAHAGPSFPETEVPAPSKQGVWSSLHTPKTKRVVQLNL